MKLRRLVSLIVCAAIILGLLPISILAQDLPQTEAVISIEPTDTDIQPGREEPVKFTVYLAGCDKVNGGARNIQFKLVIPEELEFVSGSGEINEKFSTTNFSSPTFYEGTMKMAAQGLLQGKDPYKSSTKIEVMTFFCKVKNGKSGKVTVTFSEDYQDEALVTSNNYTSYHLTVQPATLTLLKAPLIAAVAKIDAPAKDADLDTTVDIGDTTAYTAAVQWYEGAKAEGTAVTGKAKAETQYTAKITLKPNTGESFADSVTVTIADGVTATGQRQSNGSVIAAHTFPITSNAGALGGSVSISGNPICEETLTAVTTGLVYTPESQGTLSYQWYRGETKIDGATNNTYQLAAADVGNTIKVEVKNSNNSGSVTSTATEKIAKKAGPNAPVAPTLTSGDNTSDTTITINAKTGEQYACITGNDSPGEADWQTPTGGATHQFTGLTQTTQYKIYARVAETATTKASAASQALTVTTKKGPITSVTLSGIAAPVKGQQPTAKEAVTVTAPTAGLTVASIAWSPECTKFAGNTVYTATVTLTKGADESFASQITANLKIDGEDVPATASVKDGKLVITKTFPATAAKALSKLEATLKGSATNKVHGDTLKQDDLTVTATYDDGSTDAAYTGYDIKYADEKTYLKYGTGTATVTIADKTAKDENGKPVSTTVDVTMLQKELTLTGLKATDRPYAKSNTTVTLTGGTLSSIVLGEEVDCPAVTSGTIPDENAGNGKAVSVTQPTLTGTDAGNYTLAAIAGLTVNITPIDLSTITDLAVGKPTYTGAEQQAPVTSAILANTDYTLTGATSLTDVAASDATVTITGKGNYAGSVNKTWNLTPVTLSAITGLKVVTKPYDGKTDATLDTSAVSLTGVLPADQANVALAEPLPGISFESAEAGKNKKVNWASDAKLLLTGSKAGNYVLPAQLPELTGEITAAVSGIYVKTAANVDLSKASSDGIQMSELRLVTFPEGITESEFAISYEIAAPGTTGVSITGETLKASQAGNDSTVKVTVTDTKNRYAALVTTVTLNIQSTENLPEEDSYSIDSITYGGKLTLPSGIPADATLKYSGTKRDGTPVSETTTQPTDAGSYTASWTYTASGSKQHFGSAGFTIKPKELSQCTVTLDKATFAYTGTLQGPSVSVADGEKTLATADYTVSGGKAADKGQHTLTVSAVETGNYTGSAAATFEITAVPVTITATLPISTVQYTGQEIKPSVTVKYTDASSGEVTISSSEYDVIYTNNINVGTATVTVSAKEGGNYTFENAAVTFTIEKADAPVNLKDIPISRPVIVGDTSVTVDLTSALSGIEGAVIQDPLPNLSGGTISKSVTKDGLKLNFALENSLDTTMTQDVTVNIGTTNYTGVTVKIHLSVTDKPTYAITMVGGTADKASALEGDTVSITANTAPSGQVFAGWTSNPAGVVFENASSEKTTFRMPGNAVTITANYRKVGGDPEPTNTYTVTVVNGTGSGKYKAGETVSISANAAPSGQVFDKWTSSSASVDFENVSSEKTTFKMPGNDVTITATYKEDGGNTYTVTVTGGTGSGSYKVGDTVSISANAAPSGRVFDKWTSDSPGVTFVSASSASTTFMMPANDVTVTATYRSSGGGGGGGGGGSGGSSSKPGSSPSTPGSGNQSVNVPVTAAPDKDGGYVSNVSAGDINKQLDSVAKDGSIVIAPDVPSDANKVLVAIPADTASKVARSKAGSVVVNTPAANVVLANSTLGSLSKDGDVNISTEKNSDGSVSIQVSSGGSSVSQVPGGLVAELPVQQGAGMGNVAVLVNPDGSQEIVRNSIVIDNHLITPLEGSATVKIIDNSKHFNDMSGSWAQSSVDFVSSHELFQGTGNDQFSPTLSMSRGMLVTVLHRLNGEPNSQTGTSFLDVSGSTWYTEAVSWAVDYGVVTGITDNQFAPDNNVSRQEVAVMLFRYASKQGMDVSARKEITDFSDGAQVPGWSQDAIRWAAAEGILNGKNNRIDPTGNASRAEVAAMLERFVRVAAQQ